MAGKIDARLGELGIPLPQVAAPAGNYVPAVISGNLLFIAGQLPMKDGQPHYVGKLGRDIEVEDGARGARLCALNILAQARAALGGDLDRVRRVVRLGGFVNAVPEFGNHPQVLNGASDLMVEVFGEAGRHARAAVGVASLPLRVAVEIEAVFEIVAG
jgi:enamine deaminase RidA (YjgF/YER057c/UK114 family)